MRISKIRTKQDLVDLVNEIGFLPFFSNAVEGFSLEEHAADEIWYGGAWTGKINWPAWEWKGEIVQAKQLVYGKLFHGKAGFASTEWFPELCNYRRDGYDFDARYEDGLASRKDKDVITFLERNGASLSKPLKSGLNYQKGGNKGFETVITRLQMQTYVTLTDFVYQQSQSTGEYYGWGVGIYDTAEHWWGGELCTAAYRRDPQESFERILGRVRKTMPQADEKQLRMLVK